MSGEHPIRKAYQSILGHDFEQAIDWFQEAVRQEPDNADFHYKLSITYARSNRLSAALKHAEKACRLEPSNDRYKLHRHTLESKALTAEAETLMNRGKGHAYYAISMLQRAARLDPLSDEAYLLMGLAYVGLGENHKAIEALNEAVRLDPSRESAMRLLNECKERLRNDIRVNDYKWNERNR